jgi:hypothetical protein
MQEEQEFREKEARRKNMRCIEKLLTPILSLDLVKQYDDVQLSDFSVLPAKFEHAQDFISKWTELNLYEVYN